MKTSTEDLYEKYLLGHTIDEISKETGINRWALYKRFQRMQKAELSQGNNFEDNVTQKNIISIPEELQTKTSKWSDVMFAVMILTTIITGFFLYRKYYSEKPFKETK